MESLSTILSHIKTSSAFVHDAACVVRYACPNNAKNVDDLDSHYPLERLITEWRSLVSDFAALENYLTDCEDKSL